MLLLALVTAGCGLVQDLVAPAPAAGLECLGVPAATCEDYARQARERSPVALVGIRVRCTAASCTEASGEIEMTVWRVDGTVETSGAGWAVPVGTPPVAPGGPDPAFATPPVTPLCVAVPIDRCHDLAADVSTAGELFDASAVASITVRCTRICTATEGEGLTIVMLSDGERHEIGWGYSGAPAPQP